MGYWEDRAKKRQDLINHLVDATDAKTADEIDRAVCYPVPPPDSQPIAVSWGLLRKLTDMPAEIERLKAQLARCTPEACRVQEDAKVPDNEASVTLNGRHCTLKGPQVTYREIVEAAGMTGNPSVTYRASSVSGTMYEGCSPVFILRDMVFNVVHTGNA